MAINYNGSSGHTKDISGKEWIVPLTVAAWINPTAITTLHGIWSSWWSVDAGRHYRLFVDGSARLTWEIGISGVTSVLKAGVVTNAWQSAIGISAAANNHTVYLNSIQGNTSSVSKTPGAVLNKISIGKDYLWPFNGAIVCLCVWENYIFTPSDIAAYHAGLHPYKIGDRSKLTHYWPLRGTNPSARTRDMVGGLHLDTVTGTPTKTSSTHPRRGGGA